MPRTDLGRWLAIGIITALALALQLGTYPNHDVSWILWGAKEMIGGAAWGRDIIEPNPPLAWYFAMPSTLLAGLLGLPVAATFQVVVAIFALASASVFGALVERGHEAAGPMRNLPVLVVAVVLLLLPCRDFGWQREHLMLIAVLPYLALVALRCDGRTSSTAAAAAIGIAAGLGLALKPYFLAVPLLVETTALLIVGRPNFVLRTETLAIAGTIGAYCLSILLFDQNYLINVVPLAQAIYWSFDTPWSVVATPLIVPVAAAVIAAAIAWPGRLGCRSSLRRR